jgi:hypothetical protein
MRLQAKIITDWNFTYSNIHRDNENLCKEYEKVLLEETASHAI